MFRFIKPSLLRNSLIILVLIVGTWVAVGQAWRVWLAAQPVQTYPSDPPEYDIQRLLTLQVFGQITPQSVEARPVSNNYQLLGVAAGQNGFALLRKDKQPVKTLRIGEEIAPGVKLKSITKDAVILSENGNDQKVALPTRKPN